MIPLVFVHLVVAIIDLGISAAGGVAAAATGAHVNDSPKTTQVLQSGALGGVILSGILNFAALVCMASKNTYQYLVIVVLLSSFGIAVVVTLILTQKILGESKCPIPYTKKRFSL